MEIEDVSGIWAEEGEASSVFAKLKFCCLELLQFVQNPSLNASVDLNRLLDLLRACPEDLLQHLFEYVLFPLLLLLDAAVESRASPKADSSGKDDVRSPLMPHRVSDVIAETGLHCLEELLKKCSLVSLNQMTILLKKLTYGAMLPPSDASEEFREGVIRCFRALLLSLHPCDDKSCTCNQSLNSPMLLDGELQVPSARNSVVRSQSNECLLAFLQSESASVAVGHWLSLLLNAADSEAARGHRGSAKIRVEAFLSLRVLIAKVGAADALGFFLPGVVSQFAKVLHTSRLMSSGAAGSTEASDHAIRGLAEFLMIVLSDDANTSEYRASVGGMTDFRSDESGTADSFLQNLRIMDSEHRNQKESIASESNTETVSNCTSKPFFEEKNSGISGTRASLHVNRTPEWLEKTSMQVNKLLLATYPNECLYVLACDDTEEVSMPAQAFLELLLSSKMQYSLVEDIVGILDRLIEKLPKVVLGSDESLAVAHSRQLLAAMYYSGPQLVNNNLLKSPIKAARLLETFAVCLSPESAFTGSLDKLVCLRPRSSGYLHSITELNSGWTETTTGNAALNLVVHDFPREQTAAKEVEHQTKFSYKDYELPRMPPWFVKVGSFDVYQGLSGVVRLVGLSLIADCRTDVSLSNVVEVPLGHLRKLVSEIRMKEYNDERWQHWYSRTGFGQLLRQASTAVCILNEMIYGMSDHAAENFANMFNRSNNRQDDGDKSCAKSNSHWQLYHQRGVIIEGIGIFAKCLQKDFASRFLRISLYLLLENLTCSNYEVRHAADTVLQIISSVSGYPKVGNLIVENADYIIDSFSRQLRHLDLNPHIPNVLAAMLSYVGVAHKILPLLEEPMRTVSLELEILGRHWHPELTISFLKAVAEIVKAAKHEATLLPAQAESYRQQIDTKLVDLRNNVKDEELDIDSASHETQNISASESGIDINEWENILYNLNDRKRYRHIVASLANSALTCVVPLLASQKEAECLIALDITVDVVITLAEVENAYKHEKEVKAAVYQVATLCSFFHLKDTLDAAEQGSDENRLLPAVNKIWPFLVASVRNRNPVTVRRCLPVISHVVGVSGGDFFSRRFKVDGPHFWKLLTTSPFTRRPNSRDGEIRLQLPYRSGMTSQEDSISEVSSLKVQVAMLNMIGDISREKRTARALEAVLKKVSGLVVGIACSGVSGLRDASANALLGLATMDPDLVWLLVADVYYSMTKEEVDPPPPLSHLPELVEILPRLKSPKEYLFVQYGGQTYGFDIDFSSVELIFKSTTRNVSIHRVRRVLISEV
ncbi:TELO2-interacting protein 1-like protein [Drosera capensis]